MNAVDASEVIPGLFLSNEKTTLNLGKTFDLVVNCTPRVPFQEGCQACIRLPVEDDPFDSMPMFQLLQDKHVLEDINRKLEKNKRVLVHCQAGVQRSPTVVASYLIAYHGLTPDEAIAFVKRSTL